MPFSVLSPRWLRVGGSRAAPLPLSHGWSALLLPEQSLQLLSLIVRASVLFCLILKEDSRRDPWSHPRITLPTANAQAKEGSNATAAATSEQLDRLALSPADLSRIVHAFRGEMGKGLASDGCMFAMIPSFVDR